jgi:drug/metabolite transporter (DMT)-like permease
MKALQHVSVPLYALASNARPLSTALVEFVWSGTRLPFTRLLSLICIVAGAALFASNDSSVTNQGLAYAVWYTMLVAGLSVYENSMMKSMRSEQTPFGVNL